MSGNRKIVVTQENIDKGMASISSNCMVAEAVKDAVPGATKVHVDIQTIRFTDKLGVRRTYLTPSAAQAALCRYDAGDSVEPFKFSLNKAMHISHPKNQHFVKTEVGRDSPPRARVGGRQVPTLGFTTRRRFGIRNLRINQQGEVVQRQTL